MRKYFLDEIHKGQTISREFDVFSYSKIKDDHFEEGHHKHT